MSTIILRDQLRLITKTELFIYKSLHSSVYISPHFSRARRGSFCRLDVEIQHSCSSSVCEGTSVLSWRLLRKEETRHLSNRSCCLLKQTSRWPLTTQRGCSAEGDEIPTTLLTLWNVLRSHRVTH